MASRRVRRYSVLVPFFVSNCGKQYHGCTTSLFRRFSSCARFQPSPRFFRPALHLAGSAAPLPSVAFPPSVRHVACPNLAPRSCAPCRASRGRPSGSSSANVRVLSPSKVGNRSPSSSPVAGRAAPLPCAASGLSVGTLPVPPLRRAPVRRVVRPVRRPASGSWRERPATREGAQPLGLCRMFAASDLAAVRPNVPPVVPLPVLLPDLAATVRPSPSTFAAIRAVMPPVAFPPSVRPARAPRSCAPCRASRGVSGFIERERPAVPRRLSLAAYVLRLLPVGYSVNLSPVGSVK